MSNSINQHVDGNNQQSLSAMDQQLKQIKTDLPTKSKDASSSSQEQQAEQLTGISQPHPHDVLCGRGGSTNRHVGNANFRDLVNSNKALYVTLTKRQKMMVARSIVQAIRSQDPAGRFLQKDAVTGLWFDIGRPRALEKTSQALREKASSNNKSSSSSSEEKGTPKSKNNVTNTTTPSSSSSSPSRVVAASNSSSPRVITASISPSPPQCKPKIISDNGRKTSLGALSPPKVPKSASVINVNGMNVPHIRSQVPPPPPPSYRGEYHRYPPYGPHPHPPLPILTQRRTPSPPGGYHRNEARPTNYHFPPTHHEHHHPPHPYHEAGHPQNHPMFFPSSDRSHINIIPTTKNVVSPSNSYMHDPDATFRPTSSDHEYPYGPQHQTRSPTHHYPPHHVTHHPPLHHTPPAPPSAYNIRHPENMPPYPSPTINNTRQYDSSFPPHPQQLKRPISSESELSKKRQRFVQTTENRDADAIHDNNTTTQIDSNVRQQDSPSRNDQTKTSSPWQILSKQKDNEAITSTTPSNPTSFGGLDALSQAASLLVDIAK